MVYQDINLFNIYLSLSDWKENILYKQHIVQCREVNNTLQPCRIFVLFNAETKTKSNWPKLCSIMITSLICRSSAIFGNAWTTKVLSKFMQPTKKKTFFSIFISARVVLFLWFVVIYFKKTVLTIGKQHHCWWSRLSHCWRWSPPSRSGWFGRSLPARLEGFRI